jgi:hypothetical protein
MPAGALQEQKQAQDDEGSDYSRGERPAQREPTKFFGLVEVWRWRSTPGLWRACAGAVGGAARVLVFGLGPSSAIADYLVIQLGRFGLIAEALSNTGLLFADDLRRLCDGDLVVILAYGRIYAELATLLDESLGCVCDPFS